MSRLVHLVECNDLDLWFQILQYFKKMFSKGGVRRQKYTYPSLIFAMYKHATLVGKSHTTVRAAAPR